MASTGPCEASEIHKWPGALLPKSLTPHPLPSFLQGTRWAQTQLIVPPPQAGRQMLATEGMAGTQPGDCSPGPASMSKCP